MKRSFVVTIEGSWMYNDKRITQRDVEKALKDAVKQEFEFLAERVTVKPYKIITEE